MTKVCHITYSHKSTDTRIFHKQCVSLAKAGYDVYLVALLAKEDYEENGVKVRNVPSYSPFEFVPSRFKIVREIVLLRKARTLYKLVKHFFKKRLAIYNTCLEIDADIYQIHEPVLLDCAIRLKKKGKKVIFDSHEDYVEIGVNRPFKSKASRTFANFIYKVKHNFRAKKMDALITVTPHMYERFKTFNESTYMITNYPIISDYSENKTDVMSRDIIFAGGIQQQWCHELIIQALERCEDVKYILMGPVSAAKESYFNELKELPKWDKVDFLGVLPFGEVSEKLKKAAIGMALLKYSANTDYEKGTLGNTKLFEYMAEALPVICTDFMLWKGIVEKHKVGICIDPNNIDEIANAINYLINNPEAAKEMGQNGRRAVEEEFNWGEQEKKLLELYKSFQLNSTEISNKK